MRPITIHTSCENPEFPTRVRIIDLDGSFEEARDYTPPEYTFSVKVEIKYNKVVDGKEENLVTCTFWTETDSTQFSYGDEDLDEESVEEWFLEGLSEDLSFHDLEGLEDLDFYALGVPINEDDEAGKDLEDFITEAFDECISDKYCDFDYRCSDLYRQSIEIIPFTKKLETINGDCKTVWSIEDFNYERDWDDTEDINVTYVVKCSFYIKDELLFSFQYSTYPRYFISASNDLYSSVLKEIENRDFCEIEKVDKDMSGLCDSFKKYVEVLENEDEPHDSFEEYIEEYVQDEIEPNEDEEIDITLGELAEKWQEEYNQMSIPQRKAFAGCYDWEVEHVIKTLVKYQQEIVKQVEKDPNDEYEKYLNDVLDDNYNAFGIYYCEGTYYLCFDSIFGKNIEYEEHGRKSESPFTKEEIEDYVEYVYGEMCC